MVTLGTDDDAPGALASAPSGFARDSRRRYYVTATETASEPPFVYAADGTFLQQLGRRGDGPGEFRDPQAIVVDPHDTLYIFDSHRAVVLSPSYGLVRTLNGTPRTYNAVWLSSRLAVNDMRGGAPHRPLLTYSRDGVPLGAFGHVAVTTRRDQSWRSSRALARSGSFVWSVTKFFEYRIRRWSPDGDLDREFTPEAEWFPPYDSLWGATPDVAPMPRVTTAWEAHGLLWVVALTADPDWALGLGPPRKLEGQRYYPIERFDEVYDTVIEARDTADGRLVASRRLDGTTRHLTAIEPGLLAGRRETEWGWWLVDVWQVHYEPDRHPGAN